MFVPADQLVRFVELPRDISIVYRRYFSAGISSRVEVAAKMPIDLAIEHAERGPRNNIQHRFAEGAARTLLTSPVVIRGSDSPRPLKDSGMRIAKALTWATERHGSAIDGLRMQAGRPAAFAELRDLDRDDSPFIVGSKINFGSTILPLWCLHFNLKNHCSALRSQRGRMWNIHMRIEALRMVLRMFTIHRNKLDLDRLCEYLSTESRDLGKYQSHGITQQPAVAAFSLGNKAVMKDDDLDMLLLDVVERSKGLHTRLSGFIRRLEASEGCNNIYVDTGGGTLVMSTTDNSQNISGGSHIGAVVGGNSQVTGSAFSGSGNASLQWQDASKDLDLVQLATELRTLLETLRPQASSTEDYDSLAQLARAEEAARNGDNSKLRDHLSRTGKWAFGVATTIGAALAAAAIKGAMGF